MPAPVDFRPTHVVPQDGLPAWETPDVNRPTTPLDALLPVQLVDRLGDWGQIVCANGWSAWVDGRLLVSVPSAPPAAGHALTRTADPRPLLARAEDALGRYRRAAEELASGAGDGETFRGRTHGLRVGMVVDGESVWLYDAEHERWVYCDGTRLSTFAAEGGPSVHGGGEGGPSVGGGPAAEPGVRGGAPAGPDAGGGAPAGPSARGGAVGSPPANGAVVDGRSANGAVAGPESTRVVEAARPGGAPAHAPPGGVPDGSPVDGAAAEPEPTQVVETVPEAGPAAAPQGEASYGDASHGHAPYGEEPTRRASPATADSAPPSGPSARRGAADAVGPEPTRVVEAVQDGEEPTRIASPVTADSAPASGPSARRGAADAPQPTRGVEAVPDGEEPTLMVPPVTVDPAPPSRPGDA